jgi:ribosomal protein S6
MTVKADGVTGKIKKGRYTVMELRSDPQKMRNVEQKLEVTRIVEKSERTRRTVE